MSGTNKELTKIRVLAVAKMLNEGLVISASDIMRRLDLQYDIQTDRKTIYSDISAIDKMIPIMVIHGRYGGYKKYDITDIGD